MLRLLTQLVSARDKNQSTAKTLIDYAVATSIAMVALLARFATEDLFSTTGFPFICFFPAVLAAAFLTSLWPSIFCAVISIVSAWYFFIAPAKAFFPITSSDFFALCFFSAVILIDCIVIHLMKKSMMRLKTAEKNVRQANKNQDEFLAVMAHELRNPIQIIKSCVLLAQRMPDNAERKIAIIEKQASQMERIVSDLLDVARISTGKMHIAKTPIDLTEVITDAVEAFNGIAAQKHQLITVTSPNMPVLIAGDNSRLTQVIENILSNASKFSPEKSTIKTELFVENQTAKIVITDEGKGIPATLLEKIFDINVQTEIADVQKGGLGIGLALSKYIINQHDGVIIAFSVGPNKGSVFTIKIPCLQST